MPVSFGILELDAVGRTQGCRRRDQEGDAVLAGAPPNPRTVGALNPAADSEAMVERARSIGYAVADDRTRPGRRQS